MLARGLTSQVMTAVALCACMCVSGQAWAEHTAAPAAAPTQRELTEDEKALLKTLLFHTSAEPDEGPAPLTVKFSAEPFEMDDPVNPKYRWSFGDGSREVRGGHLRPRTSDFRVRKA